jgi:4'-phosphopantetheinyl transferase
MKFENLEIWKSAIPRFCKSSPQKLQGKILQEGEIHVWYAKLDQSMPSVDNIKHLLTTAEKSRVERFHFDRDKIRYIGAHAILKILLSYYLDTRPHSINFQAGRYGKPALNKIKHKGGLRFNMSHSEGIALYAITRNCEIGIDIEKIREIPEADNIVKRFFSKNEIKKYYTAPNSRKREFFFEIWTRKEAFTKAIGSGLFHPLDVFEVLCRSVKQNPLKYKDETGDITLNWSIRNLNIMPGFAAAIVYEDYNM